MNELGAFSWTSYEKKKNLIMLNSVASRPLLI